MNEKERLKNLTEAAQTGWDVSKGKLEAYPAGTLKKVAAVGLVIGSVGTLVGQKFFRSKSND